MIFIYNEELDVINIKILTNKLIKEKESRKRKEFPPNYLYSVGNFSTSFLGHQGLDCSRFLTAFRCSKKRLKFHINK